jgi:membrane-bound lytic murein transglycosylase A
MPGSQRRRLLWLVVFALLAAIVSLALGWRSWQKYRASSDPFLALSPVGEASWPVIVDDLRLDSLKQALDRNLRFLSRLDPGQEIRFGPAAFSAGQLLESQRRLRRFLEEPASPRQLNDYLREHFSLFKTGPGCRPGKMLVTGYYVPVLHGSRRQSSRFRWPLYRRPDDLVSVSLAEFGFWQRWRSSSLLVRWLMDFGGVKALPARMFGRLTVDRKVVPYYSRREIDYEQALDGRQLELVWLDDDISRFFLHIQGSGLVVLDEGGEMMVGYAAANGHPYHSIGAWLIRRGYLKREQVTMETIREFIQGHPELSREIFTANPSYVFFRELPDREPLGCWQIPLTAGRSIATDKSLFPAGVLAWLSTELPDFAADGSIAAWKPSGRLVLNQDTGGAISGSGRVDLFCGSGPPAARLAGVMKQPGQLFFLAPKLSLDAAGR